MLTLGKIITMPRNKIIIIFKKQSAKEAGPEYKLSAAGLVLSQGLLCSGSGSEW